MSIDHDELHDYLTGEGYIPKQKVEELLEDCWESFHDENSEIEDGIVKMERRIKKLEKQVRILLKMLSVTTPMNSEEWRIWRMKNTNPKNTQKHD